MYVVNCDTFNGLLVYGGLMGIQKTRVQDAQN